jgi:hypothetical protein
MGFLKVKISRRSGFLCILGYSWRLLRKNGIDGDYWELKLLFWKRFVEAFISLWS